MYDLTQTTTISFEIGADCNLKSEHPQCPINQRVFHKDFGPITVADIIKAMEEAEEMGFRGMVGFHNYNEPLLYQNLILQVMEAKPDVKYLLWTNGTLLSRKVEDNQILRRFAQVVITCYDEEVLPFYQSLKEYYGNIDIATWELDDRLDAYTRNYVNEIGCKRILFDLPIDHYGNVHLCCMDWNYTYKIGNIRESGLKKVVEGVAYQKAIATLSKRLLDRESCPPICKNCDKAWVRYPKPE